MAEPTNEADSSIQPIKEEMGSNRASNTNMQNPMAVVQLAAIQENLDSYWDIKNPCDAAMTEYLARRPYEVDRFVDASDHVKATVLTRVPEQVHAWFRSKAIRTPIEPPGFRNAIVREMLLKFKNYEAYNLLVRTIGLMRTVGYQWPEFDVIGKAAETELLLRQKSDEGVPE